MLYIKGRELNDILMLTQKHFGIDKSVLSLTCTDILEIPEKYSEHVFGIMSHHSYEDFCRHLLYDWHTEHYHQYFDDLETAIKALYIVSEYLWHIRCGNSDDIYDINAYIREHTIDDMIQLCSTCNKALDGENTPIGTVEIRFPKLKQTIKLNNWNNWVIQHLLTYSSEHLPEIGNDPAYAEKLWISRHHKGHKEDKDYKSTVFGAYNLLKEFYNGNQTIQIPNCIRQFVANFIELHGVLFDKHSRDITMDNIGATIKSCFKKEPPLLCHKVSLKDLEHDGRSEYLDIGN